jgi:cyanophycinase
MSDARGASALIALVGGEEFRPQMRAVDDLLIGHLGRSTVRAAILPTAAAHESPELAAGHGVRHFQGLGVQARAVMVVDKPSADDARLVEQLEDINLVYLAGGDPKYLLDTLRGSRIWEHIAAMARRGGCVIAGSSAGAMVLGEAMHFRGDWQPALGLVPAICVLPHFERRAVYALRELQDSLPREGLVLLGIDGSTACIGSGSEWKVAGRGSVSVIRHVSTEVFQAGQRIASDAAGRV